MKSDLFEYFRCLFIAVLFMASMFFMVTLIIWINNCVNENTMNKLGYESKMVNMDCFAKHDGRWILCESVIKNNFDVNHKEMK